MFSINKINHEEKLENLLIFFSDDDNMLEVSLADLSSIGDAITIIPIPIPIMVVQSTKNELSTDVGNNHNSVIA